MEYHSGGSLPLLGRPRYCPGANANGGYLCETGHCCGETGCCTYYYELWWFWLLWTVLILFSCCCAYRHRRAKLRVQQQQRQRDISLLAYTGATAYNASMLDLSFLASLKLPSYEEVAAQPSTPPPPYSSVFTAPRYPQPPRTADPHLLTQHGPILHHRPLSDGPSSLSSDNSSSCSCDSCCPSSPCSSSLSAPVTYETDTSHATTPGDAPPLALDVTMETIAAAATRLEAHEETSRCGPPDREGLVTTVTIDVGDDDEEEEELDAVREPAASDSVVVPNRTVTVAMVTRAASPPPHPLPSGATSPMKQQGDPAPDRTCSPSPGDTTLPSVPVKTTMDHQTTPSPSRPPTSGPSTPTDVSRPSETLNPTRTFETPPGSGSPTRAPSPDAGRTLVPPPTPVVSTSGLAPIPEPANLNPASVPALLNLPLNPVAIPADPQPGPTDPRPPQNLTQASVPTPTPDAIPTNFTQESQEPGPTDLTRTPDGLPKTWTQDPQGTTDLTPMVHQTATVPDRAPTPATDAAPDPPSPGRRLIQDPPPYLALGPTSPRSAEPASPGVPVDLLCDVDPGSGSGSPPVLSRSSDLNQISPLPANSGSGVAPGPVLTLVAPADATLSPCPSITVESESCAPPRSSPPLVLSPPSPPTFTSCLRSPPALSCASSPPAPALLLDPLTALHQSGKGGSSSGHASSLSPSPRATQSPPKQTLFSPCVDVFEPGPPSWEDEDEEEEEVDRDREQEDNDDDEDEDMGADESQYRHRRLTGDSGIEVCRCRVEEEEEEEEEEKVDGRRGGGGGGGGGERGGLHDSVDCPARGQITTGEELTRCGATSTSTSTATPVPEDGGKVVVVMETV